MSRLETSTDSLLAGASAALEAGRPADAIELLRGAIRADPLNALYHFHLGNLLLDGRQPAEAEACFREAFRLDANIASVPLRLGIECAQAGMLEEAQGCLELALSFGRDNPPALICLGDVLRRQGRNDEALRTLRRAASLAPDSADALLNLGIALEHADRLDEAVAALEGALRLRAGDPRALNNLAMVWKQLGRPPETLRLMHEAVRLAPDFAEARFNRAMLLLLMGDFEQGWSDYEWRPKRSLPGGRGLREHLQSGLPLEGQRVLLHAEQGLGDLIQFVRYAAWLHARGANVIVECPASAHDLIQTAPGVSSVTSTETLPDFDLNAHLLSLPGLVHPRGAALAANVPYLRADPRRVAHWSERLRREGHPCVGLVWAGSPAHLNDRRRSMPLAELSPILTHPNAAVYSLQVGPGAAGFRAHGGAPGREWGVASLSETAAMIMCLDLVISVDTMPAHLAGALGKPVWTLLSFAPDWRWGLEREDTPWYPSMRLFRQPRPGDWKSVVQRAAGELDRLKPGGTGFRLERS